MLKWWTEYRLERLRLKLAAQNKPFEVMAEAIKAQSQFLQDWLSGFKMTDLPTSSTVRDIDEYQAELERNRGMSDNLVQSVENAMKANAFPELRSLLKGDDI